MKYCLIIISIILLYSCTNQSDKVQIRGWNILSDHEQSGLEVIKAAKEYNINHLELSHHVVMDLKDLQDSSKLRLAKLFINKAHQEGIKEVVVWDHVLYGLDYYPNEYKTSIDSLINLDNPNFWKWFKNDYRRMLNLIPESDGIVLTFIETGARVEEQYSEVFKSKEEKLAAIVDTIASIVCDERNKKLYIRSFAYHKKELESMIKCINLVKNKHVIVMTKEVPHDFFLTHPVASFAKQIKLPQIIEFDCAHEFNGQGIISSIFPEIHAKRLKYYLSIPNVIGYVARTDRYGKTQIIHSSNAINLYALKRVAEDTSIQTDEIYNEFITLKYGKKSLPFLIPVFKSAQDIILSSLYTLGCHNNTHSKFTYDNQSSYSRHVSGKWLDNPIVYVSHDVNKNFQYWKDVVNHLSPSRYKEKEGTILSKEAKWVIDSNWVQAEELMDSTYLSYILLEKNYSVNLAKEQLINITKAKEFISDTLAYTNLYHQFYRTYLTTQLYHAMAKAYFGYRIWCRGENFRSQWLKKIITEGLIETKNSCDQIKQYPYKGEIGQFNWDEDATTAMLFYQKISQTGWTEYGSAFKE